MSRADVDEFLARVDEVTAPTCGACTATLDPAGPSLYFCDDLCSDRWHQTQAEPLVGYREPWHRPDEFPGVGGEAFRPNGPAAAPRNEVAELARLIAEHDRTMSAWHAEVMGRSEVRPAAGFNVGIGDSDSTLYVQSSRDDAEWVEVGRVQAGSLRFSIHDETLDGGRTIVGEPPMPRRELREFAPPPSPPRVTSAWDQVSVSWAAADRVGRPPDPRPDVRVRLIGAGEDGEDVVSAVPPVTHECGFIVVPIPPEIDYRSLWEQASWTTPRRSELRTARYRWDGTYDEYGAARYVREG